MKNSILKITTIIPVIFLFFTLNVQAQPAMNCLSVTEDDSYGVHDNGTYVFKNQCRNSIVVAWCLEDSNNDDECGSNDNDLLYANKTKLDPGETYKNMWSMEAKYNISYAACFSDNAWTTRPVAINRQGDFKCSE